MSITLNNSHGQSFQLPVNLRERCMDRYNWAQGFADQVLNGYQQFMKLSLQHEDWGSTSIVPSPPVRKAWELHILDLKHYTKACQDYTGGQLISQDLSATSGTAEHKAKLLTTKVSLVAAFGKNGIVTAVWSFDDEDQPGQEENNQHNAGASIKVEDGNFPVPDRLFEKLEQDSHFLSLDGTVEEVVKAYQQMMRLKLHHQDWDGKRVKAPASVETAWDYHRLNNEKHYEEACRQFTSGHSIIPENAKDYDNRMIDTTITALKAMYGRSGYDNKIWWWWNDDDEKYYADSDYEDEEEDEGKQEEDVVFLDDDSEDEDEEYNEGDNKDKDVVAVAPRRKRIRQTGRVWKRGKETTVSYIVSEPH